MLNEIKEKVKETGNKVKEWTSENAGNLIAIGVPVGLIIAGCVVGRKYDKKFETAWRAAKAANDNQDLDYDFGPYKVMCFIEPITREFIGETMCHEDTMKMYLNVK